MNTGTSRAQQWWVWSVGGAQVVLQGKESQWQRLRRLQLSWSLRRVVPADGWTWARWQTRAPAKAWGGVPDTLARTVELACLKCSICRVRMAVEETRRVGWLVSRRSVCLARRWELCCFVCAWVSPSQIGNGQPLGSRDWVFVSHQVYSRCLMNI